jgi:hypothetical protein
MQKREQFAINGDFRATLEAIDEKLCLFKLKMNAFDLIYMHG